MEKQKTEPRLRFSEFDGDWEKKNLGDVMSIKSKKYNPVTDSEPFNCIELEHLVTDTGQLLGYTDSTGAGSIKNRFEKGDVLFGKLRPYLRKYLFAPFKGVCSSEIWVITGKNTLNEYIYWLIQTNRFIGLANQSSGSKMPRADWEVISSSAFYFPTHPEQQKIASFFTTIDQKLSQLKQKKILLDQYKKGVIQKITNQKIRFKDDEGREFPRWEKLHGNAIFETVSKKNHNSDLPILAITQEHGAIPREMINYYISVTEQSIESYKVVEKGDFIISLRSFQGGIEYSDYKGICSPAYIILRAIKNIDNRYFKYYFKTETYITELNRKLEGIRDGKMISYKYFSDIQINVPCPAEQTKIANFLSAIDDKINQTQKQIEKAEIWKKGLLQMMFV